MLHSFSETVRSFLLILALSTCFTTAFDLQAKVEQLEKNYVRIKEHLEAKIMDLETKVGRLEDKVKEQDSLLAVLKNGHKPLKDSVDINQHHRYNAILRTCHEIYAANPSFYPGMYWIDPDGHGIGDPPISVHCDMVTMEDRHNKGERLQMGVTSILHDGELIQDIGHCTKPGCVSKQFKYKASERQIAALIQLSNSCTQAISYLCKNSPLNYNGTAYAWWNDKDGKRHEFSDWLTCDQLSNKKHAIYAVIKNGSLPLSRVHFSNPFQGSGQYTVSRLRCNGKAKLKAMPTSCTDLWRMGRTLNGIYSIRGAKQMETVFCQFDKRPDEQGYQTWIGYVDVKSLPTYFNVQRKSYLRTMKVPIPFEVDNVNVGNAMNLTTGIFTAPRGGIYFFSFNGLAASIPTEKGLFATVGLFLNAIQVSETMQQEGNVTTHHFHPLTIQSTLKLKANDRVWLEIISLELKTMLFDDKDGYTRFTGFMLDEEFAMPK